MPNNIVGDPIYSEYWPPTPPFLTPNPSAPSFTFSNVQYVVALPNGKTVALDDRESADILAEFLAS